MNNLTGTVQKKSVLISLFIMSSGALAFEVAITRVYSFLFLQSYVYILVSCGIAGIGFGSVISYFVPEKKRKGFLQILTFLPAGLLILLFLLNTITTMLLASLLLTFLLFSSLGVMQVQVFQKSGIPASRLYASDLIGAALGSVSSYLLLNQLGTLSALFIIVLYISASFLAINLIFYPSKKFLFTALAGVTLLVFTGLISNLGYNMLPDRNWQKEMTIMLGDERNNPVISDTRWNAFGRIDQVETDNPFFKTLFIDGGAGTKMVRMENDRVPEAVAESLLLQYMGGIPLLVIEEEKRQKAAVIGSGGGIDVVTLLLADYKHIDAVEINPGFIQLVQEQTEYTGEIYNNHPRVSIHYDEGRSFLRNSGSRYNLILMGLPIIKSVRSLSNHSLTENYLFTWNAFDDYFQSLEDDGFLVIIAHYPNELYKLFVNAVKAMKEGYGMSSAEAATHIVSIGSDQNPTLIIKKGAFTQAELTGYETILNHFPVRGSTNFIPFTDNREVKVNLNPSMLAILHNTIDLEQFIESSEENIAWVSDDSPFFYQMDRGTPGELTLVAIIIGASLTMLAALFFLHPLLTRKKDISRHADNPSGELFLFAFLIMGLAYMLVEIAILQKFITFWRHQTLALAVVLSIILLSTGAGSLFSGRIRSRKGFLLALSLLIILQVSGYFLFDGILLRFEQARGLQKVALSFLLLFPQFFFMGVPFPYCLSKLRQTPRGLTLYPWMIGINSLASLAGGVASFIIAVNFGYSFVAVSGIAAYAVLAVLFCFLSSPCTSLEKVNFKKSRFTFSN